MSLSRLIRASAARCLRTAGVCLVSSILAIGLVLAFVPFVFGTWISVLLVLSTYGCCVVLLGRKRMGQRCSRQNDNLIYHFDHVPVPRIPRL